MAVMSVGPSLALNTDDFNVGYFVSNRDGVLGDFTTIVSKSSTEMVIDEGMGYVAHLTGHDVTYDAFGEVTGGTITGISETRYGQTTYDITDLNVDAARYYMFASSGTVTEGPNTYSATVFALPLMFGGNDTFNGTEHADKVASMDGHDYVFGGDGADTIDGGGGNDHLFGESALGGRPDGADSISGGTGDDYIQGNAGNDTLAGSWGNDRIQGGADDDVIRGDDGNDSINGNKGNDTIQGGDGNDTLRGGQGDDVIDGGAGSNVLMGDLGDDRLVAHGDRSAVDTLTGGDGADIFDFHLNQAPLLFDRPWYPTPMHIVMDFQEGVDHIDLSFTPQKIIIDSTIPDGYIQQLGDRDLGGSPETNLLLLPRGEDTYVVWAVGVGGMPTDGFILHNVEASTLTAADFI